MSTEIKCPSCGGHHRVADRMLGHQLNCPSCDQPIRVPSREELEAALGDTDAFDADQPPADQPPADRSRSADEAAAVSVQPLDLEHHASPADLDDEDGVEPPPLARKSRDDGELDMTPMVDVTFLLLIFFMVTASFSLQKSIPMPRSQSDQPSTNTEEQEEDDFETVTVEIDEYNGYLIIAADFERECTSKLAITSGLREAFNSSAGGMRLAITVHEKAKLQSLVDVMDAGTIANYAEIQITEVEHLD
ncbi:ExbD/TolR family protein [Roseimaritima sediminicola]|uniref:ExbD/TolR family protein n=1 Tax=Roseimaritima sediminicola TaxID=2662066 RepID=UPI0012985019|nr:biopolymer transporter ExbD [Roseimaritima sediminicola]